MNPPRLLLLLLLFPTQSAAAAVAATQPTAISAPTTAPAVTPGEAMLRVLEAMAAGDEAAYRRAVVFQPPAEYAEATARAVLASARLHRAVREHGVAAQRTRDAGFDRGRTLVAVETPHGERLEQQRQALRQMRWEIDGDTARPTGAEAGGGGRGAPTVQRRGDGWVVVLTDPPGAGDADEVAQLVRAEAVNADAFDAAAQQVEAGKLRTIREVNDFIEARRNAAHERAVAALGAEPKGPLVFVTDAETGKPVAGAKVWAKFVAPPARIKSLSVTTDERGRARLVDQPNDPHGMTVEADGYARLPADTSFEKGEAGAPDEIHIEIGKPAIVDVELVLPDDRRVAVSVFEGDLDAPAPPGVRGRLEPKRVSVPVKWEDDPPPLPKHHPMLILHLPSFSPHKDAEGVVHRVTRARTAAGRELPVFRDAPPKDEATFGVYDIGEDGMENRVFVIGTLTDARAVDVESKRAEHQRNERVLGPVTETGAGR